ncbi:hypothetical protein IMCC3317_25500 [Kordia antarctica]|uniref:Uncharacterized protein n=1 Tax=Kordia antarctica TaxID=1218801 RepID=A0A7L4ZKN8_9FLAO|nr:hypothetical protein IMCC3317_25500 [Kordia antarctica]
MKKSNVKLSLNKKRISTLKTTEIHGGLSGVTCYFTNQHYKTCNECRDSVPSFIISCQLTGFGC